MLSPLSVVSERFSTVPSIFEFNTELQVCDVLNEKREPDILNL